MKKGFTLVELICVLSILGIISTVIICWSSFFKSIEEDTSIEMFLYDLEDSLCFGREYSRGVNKMGRVTLIEYENKFIIKFTANNGYEEIKELNKSLSMKGMSSDTFPKVDTYDISNFGSIQAKSTYFLDKRGNEYQLSINPVVNNIYIGGKR